LVIHFVVAEDLYYAGRNGISNHKHVMRKMIPTPDGQSFTINLNETKDIPQTINLDPLWNADSLNIIVFVQSTASMSVYQSETIRYDELSFTEVGNKVSTVSDFKLGQNYPNPFNPSTTIKYQISQNEFVSLKVFDILGNEVAELVNEEKPSGNYEVGFNASRLTSGVYFYTLTSANFNKTKKMILLR